MSKYNSNKYEVDGIEFDSRMEALYYQELKQMVESGEIKYFSLQPKFILIPKFEKNGKKYREMTYTPDFKVIKNDDREVYVDVKGFGNQQSEMRKKLFDYLYRDKELIWLSYSKKHGGWLNYESLIKARKESKKLKNEL